MDSCDSSIYEFDLDENEIDIGEYDIPPPGSPPSLDSVLKELDDDESKQSLPFSTHKEHVEGSLLQHVILQGVSSQIISAMERISAGFPTTITASTIGLVSVGTAHGLILVFDASQALRWCNRESDHGAVSAMSFNSDATRLIAGYERGHINMLDATSGDILRSLPEAHAPHTAVLHLQFTDWPSLAFCADSAGCVFSLTFSRRLAVRTWTSKCLFSGARGEVCVLQPLLGGEQDFKPHLLLAMATLSKIIVVSVRPRLRIVFTHPLLGSSGCLPLIAWQPIDSVLAFSRGTELYLFRVGLGPNGIRAMLIRRGILPQPLRALHWLGTRSLSCLDGDEILRLLDAKLLVTRETIDLSSVGLVYASAHFKALATGGRVSIALAKAGEYACYNSMVACGRRLLILGFKGLHAVSVRTTSERLRYLRETSRWADALQLATASGSREKALQFVRDYLLQNMSTEGLRAAINCAVTLNEVSLLCGEIWEKASKNEESTQWFFTLLFEHITTGRVTKIEPIVAQAMVTFCEETDNLKTLESLLPSLDISCLDLHQLLSACRKHNLYSTTLWLSSAALRDYTRPLIELLPILIKSKDSNLGNMILVYVSCCLAGRAYPHGELSIDEACNARSEVLCYLLAAPHSLLHALLYHDAHASISMFELAFIEPDFSGELGSLRRQQVIKLLLDLTGPEQKNAVMGLIARSLLAKTLPLEDFLIPVENWLITLDSGPQHYAKEQLWMEMIAAGILSHFDDQKQLEMARSSKCYRVEELLLERAHEYSHIVQCYLSDDIRRKDVFSYMKKHSNSPGRDVQTQLFERFEELYSIDEKQTIELVMHEFPELIVPLAERSVSNPTQLLSLLSAAVKIGAPVSSCMANLAQEAGDIDLAARLLELSGDLAGALNLLLQGDAATKAAALCARSPEPARLLSTVSEPRMMGRLLRATLADCAYETLLYETTFKLMSIDLHKELSRELVFLRRGKFLPKGTVGCHLHKNMCEAKPCPTSISYQQNELAPRPDLEGVF